MQMSAGTGKKKADVKQEMMRSFSEAGQMSQAFLDAHKESCLARPEEQNQRSQLALCYAEGLSEEFIEKLFSEKERSPVESDLLRILALLAGEEEALKKSDSSLTVGEVKDLIRNEALKAYLPDLKEAAKLTRELEENRKRFDRELNFLKSERKSMQDSYEAWVNESGENQKALAAAKKENADLSVKLAVSEKEKEIRDLKEELKSSREISKEAEKSRERPEKGFFKRKSEKKREEVLISAFSEKNLKEEQREVLKDAYRRGLSCGGLLKLTDENIPLENLKPLENLLLKKECGKAAGEEF